MPVPAVVFGRACSNDQRIEPENRALNAPTADKRERRYPDLEPEPETSIQIMLQELRFARTMSARAWGTIALVGIIIAVYLFVSVVADLLGSRLRESVPYEVVVLLGAKSNPAIESGQYWRIGTHILLHGNLLHLAVNAYALWVLGTVLERLYGLRRFLIVFLLSGFGGAISSYLFTSANSVGASGAIFGLLGAAVVFGVKFHGVLPARIRRLLTMGLLPWVALNLFIGTVFPQIDNAAHVGGMVTGAVVAVFLGSRLRPQPKLPLKVLQWAVLAASLAFMAYAVAAGVAQNVRCGSSVPALEQCLQTLAPEAASATDL